MKPSCTFSLQNKAQQRILMEVDGFWSILLSLTPCCIQSLHGRIFRHVRISPLFTRDSSMRNLANSEDHCKLSNQNTWNSPTLIILWSWTIPIEYNQPPVLWCCHLFFTNLYQPTSTKKKVHGEHNANSPRCFTGFTGKSPRGSPRKIAILDLVRGHYVNNNPNNMQYGHITQNDHTSQMPQCMAYLPTSTINLGQM